MSSNRNCCQTGRPEKDLSINSQYVSDIVGCNINACRNLNAARANIAGNTIIGGNLTVLGDIINNEIDGLLTRDNAKDYRNAVNRLLNNDSERNRLAQNARISVEKLSVENCAKKHISLYNTYSKN